MAYAIEGPVVQWRCCGELVQGPQIHIAAIGALLPVFAHLTIEACIAFMAENILVPSAHTARYGIKFLVGEAVALGFGGAPSSPL